MTELDQYVRDLNEWRVKFFKQEPLTVAQHRQQLLNRVDSDLSPENLTCDGELPRAEVQRRYNFLMRVREQLVDMADG
jgi:hypothetical protein